MRDGQVFNVHARRFSELRDPKIKHLNSITTKSVRLEPDVIGFQIAMDDALLMCFMNGRANLLQNIYDPIERQAILLEQHVTQGAPVEVFHHQIGNAFSAAAREPKISNINNVRMAQAARRACFTLEALDEFFVAHELRRNQFQSHVTLSPKMRRQIHRAHAALSEQTLEAILVVKYLSDVVVEWSHAIR